MSKTGGLLDEAVLSLVLNKQKCGGVMNSSTEHNLDYFQIIYLLTSVSRSEQGSKIKSSGVTLSHI